MVFVMLGTQKEQFSRILDYVVNSKILKKYTSFNTKWAY